MIYFSRRPDCHQASYPQKRAQNFAEKISVHQRLFLRISVGHKKKNHESLRGSLIQLLNLEFQIIFRAPEYPESY